MNSTLVPNTDRNQRPDGRQPIEYIVQPPQRGCPVRILTPKRVRKLLGVWRGGRWVGQSAAGVPGGRGGSVGTPNIHASK